MASEPEAPRSSSRPSPAASSESTTPTSSGSAHVLTGLHAHSAPVHDLLDALGVREELGLTTENAARVRAKVGSNTLPTPPRRSAIAQFIDQLVNPLVLTLIVAAFVAGIVGASSGGEAGTLERYGDAIAIVLIVTLNAFLGFFQERRAEAALDALQKIAAPSARVLRDGKVVVIAAAEVVPGDVIELESGDAIPADVRLIHTMDLSIEEAALTGESVPVTKDARAHCLVTAPLAERVTMAFLGTHVSRGRGRGVVTSTGANTELGRIGAMIAHVSTDDTPLAQRLKVFGQRVLFGCIALSVVLFAWGMIRPAVVRGAEDRPWTLLLLEAVSLAVAAIPEGLPAITTITLALGMQRMAKLGAIVRKLPAVETLGAATVICTDKTGTLTQNQMVVRRVWAAREHFTVKGEGYAPEGSVHREDGEKVERGAVPAPLAALLETAALCNDAHIRRDAETGQWKVVGDPTEGALLALAERGGVDTDPVRSSVSLVRELPFDSDRKRMTVVTLDARGREVAHVKGSVEVLLPRCTAMLSAAGVEAMTDETREAVLAEADAMSHDAYRVLALCERDRPEGDPEEKLTLLGLVGMIDPPRLGVSDAIAACSDAGIRVMMITGDHKLTASAIAREIGLWKEGDLAMTGAELAELDDRELVERVEQVRVFARATAAQKLRIVKALKARDHVVAMTGDGVNDAPALKEAHIGIAMGRDGTDVARQAADLVLADDNFATIVSAVREGRAIYRNIQKFVFFLLSSNLGLCFAVFTTALTGSWLSLTPLMILWINLVTNGLPALALGIDPPSGDQMHERPRPLSEGLLTQRDALGILYVGGVMGALSLVMYEIPNDHQGGDLEGRALAFSLLALSPLFHAFACRSSIASIASVRPFVSPPLLIAIAISAAIHLVSVLFPTLRPVFKTFPITGAQWGILLVLSAAIIPAFEVWKAGVRLVANRSSSKAS